MRLRSEPSIPSQIFDSMRWRSPEAKWAYISLCISFAMSGILLRCSRGRGLTKNQRYVKALQTSKVSFCPAAETSIMHTYLHTSVTLILILFFSRLNRSL